MPNWTLEQSEAINDRGKNLLVAAAAGSGKTAVLVERIKKLVTEEDVSLDSMLIVTFTNAAAAEMREKIRKAIEDVSRTRPELRKQLDILPRADICTFHAFAMKVVKKFFFKIDREPEFHIADETQRDVLIEESLDSLFERYFSEQNNDFIKFLDWYGGEKDNEEAKNIIRTVYTNIMALPDPFDALHKKVEELGLPPDEYEKTQGMKYFWKIIGQGIDSSISNMEIALQILEEGGLSSLGEKIEIDISGLMHIKDLLQAELFEEALDNIGNFKFSRLSAKKHEKDDYKLLKSEIDGYRDRGKDEIKNIKELIGGDYEERIKSVEKSYFMAQVLEKILLDFHTIFSEKKREKGLIDFNDIEQDSLKILRDEEVANYYKNKFEHIFVDEYQDTGVIQEEIIKSVARDNNIFMVGDVKQSIYKFRLAEPELFKDKYRKYKNGEIEKSKKIDLNRNFRSKSPILSWINDRFRPIMDGYNREEELYPGFEDDGEYSFVPKVNLLSTEFSNVEDEYILELNNREREALLIGKIIKENLGKEYYDNKSNSVKKLRYGDMVILTRNSKGRSALYSDILESLGIPTFVSDDQGYFDTMEINVFMNLLSIIDNKYKDIPFISVLRSEIFGFTTEELTEVRLREPRGSYVEGFCRIAEEAKESEFPSNDKNDFSTKCKEVLDKIKYWKEWSMSLPLSEFVWRLLLDSGYYIIAGALPYGVQRQANLRILCDKTDHYEKNGEGSLFGFLSYIDRVKKNNKVNIGQVKLIGENDDVVRIMTIHKSKGLEFPLVIVSDLGGRLRYSDKKDKVIFHKDIGLGMKIVDLQLRTENTSLPYDIIINKVKREEYEEHIRVLYVALTRAKDKLFLTGTVENEEKYLYSLRKGGKSTFLMALGEMPNVEISKLEDLSDHEGLETEDIQENEKDNGKLEVGNFVNESLSYKYPYKEALQLRSKYSVSTLNELPHMPLVSRIDADVDEYQGNIENYTDINDRVDINLPKPKFILGERKLSGAEIGTAYHKLLENLDFALLYGISPNEILNSIKLRIKALVEENILLEKEADIIDIEKILSFFNSSLGKRAIKAATKGNLYKEQQFTMRKQEGKEDIMIQGIIDCFFIEDKSIILIDYKTNRINEEVPWDQEETRFINIYGRQLSIYAESIEKAIGLKVSEAYLYLLNGNKKIRIK